MVAGSMEGKVAIITGAARGQGEAAARLFVEQGASVLVADVLEEQGRELASNLGKSAAFYPLDVGSELDWAAVADLARTRFGGVDVLVNNAAIHQSACLEQTNLEMYERVVRVNQVGCFLGMRMAASEMALRGGGSIVNVSSVNALTGVPNSIAYSASKSALRSMSKSAAVELGPRGIRVNTVFPGAVNTPMIPDSEKSRMTDLAQRLPIPRIAGPDEVAHLVLFLASSESSYCTGAEFVVDGGLTAGIVAS